MPRRSLALLFLVMAGIVVCPPVVLISIYLGRQSPPVATAQEARAAYDAFAGEMEAARKYGLVWPEAEALLENFETIAERDAGVRGAFCRAAEGMIGEVARRRGEPRTWRPIPPRSLADVYIEGGRVMRRYWTPGGVVEERVWLAASAAWPMPAGAEVLVVADAMARGAFEEEARRMNRVVLDGTAKPAAGLWFPAGWDDESFGAEFSRSVLLIGFRRYAALLGEYTLSGESEDARLAVKASADAEVEVGGVGVFDPPEEGGQRFAVVEVRPVGGGWAMVRPVEGLSVRLGGEELVVRDPVHPARRLEGPCDLPGLVLCEWPTGR